MSKRVIYNRVLLPQGALPWREYVDADGSRGAAADGSALSFMVEELISRSAVQVVLAGSSDFTEGLSPLLRSRVSVVDVSPSERSWKAFLGPVLDEFGFDPGYGWSGGLLGTKWNSFEPDLRHHLSELLHLTQPLLLGMSENLQIDVNLDTLRNAAQAVRQASRSPDGRACLATLEGLLATYAPHEVPGLVALPEARPELVELFHRLVNDEAYKQAAEGAAGLGMPDRFRRSVELMRRAVQRVLDNRVFKNLFNFGAKVVTTATQVQMPNSQLAESLLERGYLPPIVSLREPLQQSLDLWAQLNPDMVHPDPKTVVADAGKAGDFPTRRTSKKSDPTLN